MHLQNQLIFVVQSQGIYSTSSLATVPEMLAMEVTPGLLAGAEPNAHQFNVTICLKGVINWKQTRDSGLNSETRPGMHERVRS
jgi:hypothetical protein